MRNPSLVLAGLLLGLAAPGLSQTSTDADLARAKAGSLAAMVKVGEAYRTGNGIGQNYTEAFRWLSLASAKGSAKATRLLGEMYDSGNGVTKDRKEALRLYRSAAAKGEARAMWHVGMAYLIGEAVPKNPVESVRWFRLSAAKGDSHGRNSLGAMLTTGNGVGRDPSAALKLFQLAADQGHSSALYNMAKLYREGLGVAKDEEEAYRLVQAAKSANPEKWRTFVVQIAPATLVAAEARPAPAAPAKAGRYPWIVNRGSTTVTLSQNAKQICVMAPGQSCGTVFVADQEEVHFFAVNPNGAHDSFYRQRGRDAPLHVCIDDGPLIREC